MTGSGASQVGGRNGSFSLRLGAGFDLRFAGRWVLVSCGASNRFGIACGFGFTSLVGIPLIFLDILIRPECKVQFEVCIMLSIQRLPALLLR